MQTGGEYRAVNLVGELLHARIQRVTPDRARRGLNDAGVRPRLHQTHQRGQALARHDAVGIQHHHVPILGAPAPAEVVDVSALSFHAAATVAVKQPGFSSELFAQGIPRIQFRYARVRICRIRQHEEIEEIERATAFDRFVRCPQARKYTAHVLVADRHHNRRARFARQRRCARRGA